MLSFSQIFLRYNLHQSSIIWLYSHSMLYMALFLNINWLSMQQPTIHPLYCLITWHAPNLAIVFTPHLHKALDNINSPTALLYIHSHFSSNIWYKAFILFARIHILLLAESIYEKDKTNCLNISRSTRKWYVRQNSD